MHDPISIDVLQSRLHQNYIMGYLHARAYQVFVTSTGNINHITAVLLQRNINSHYLDQLNLFLLVRHAISLVTIISFSPAIDLVLAVVCFIVVVYLFILPISFRIMSLNPG